MYYEEPDQEDGVLLPTSMDDSFTRPVCSARLEELAKPKKRLVSHVWAMYSYLFTPERREAVRMLLQELYAMTPEETAQYFDVMSSVLKKIEEREKLKRRLAKKYQDKVKKGQRKRAFKKFEMMLRQAMRTANEKPLPPLVTPRLRNISDVVLQQLCELLGIAVPDRTDITDQAQFVMNVADYFAIGIENTYYEIQVQKNKEFEAIEEEIRVVKEEEEEQRQKELKEKERTSVSSKQRNSKA